MASCQHCHAPLPHGQILCKYCGAANDIDLSGLHYYTTHRPEQTRLCPGCRAVMETLDLGSGKGHFLVERCPACSGLFFDPGELDTLVAQKVRAVFSIDHKTLSSLRESAQASSAPVCYRPCPICGTLMNRENFGEISGVIVDTCRGHGVYLDAGELQQIMQWVRAGGAMKAELKRRTEAQDPRPAALREPREAEISYQDNESELSGLLAILVKLLRRFFSA